MERLIHSQCYTQLGRMLGSKFIEGIWWKKVVVRIIRHPFLAMREQIKCKKVKGKCGERTQDSI